MILVTGATGNVGRHVLNLLVAGGHAVRVLSRSPQEAVWPDILATWAAAVGRTAPTTPDIEKVTRRRARGYHDWVLDHATAFSSASDNLASRSN